MKQHVYSSYEEYVAAQIEGNKRKLSNVWVRPETINTVMLNAPASVAAVMCHGTRNGAEQELFKAQFPRAYIIGTEISDTAKNYKYTVQHDFHVPVKGWLHFFDIVYSNSWDHSFDPLLALSVWRDQLKLGGRLFLEHGIGQSVNICNATDPLQIDEYEVLELLEVARLKLVGTFNARGVKGGPDHASIVYIAESAV